MFRRAGAHSAHDDEVIDLRERLAPYGEVDLSPEWQEGYLGTDPPRAQRRHTASHAPRHMAQ